MRDHVRAFCAAAVEAFECRGPVVEFGSRTAEGAGPTANLRPLFPQREYIGCDMRAGAGVDRVEDIACTTFANGAAGTVICLDTLEHVFAVHDAFAEMHRILAPGGQLIVATPLRFPIHNHPQDYWRMTPACVDRLASSFALRVIGWQGSDDFPHTVYLAALKAPLPADAEARARRLIAAHTTWLAAARRARPLLTKARESLKTLYRSKGERRELANAYSARFEIRS